MWEARYIIIFAFTIAVSCTNSSTEEQTKTNIRDIKEEPQLGDNVTAIKEAEQKQVEKYDTVAIGQQIWMANNLNVSHFRNGDKIPHAATTEEWKKAAETKSPAWCYYDNDEANGKKYGKLYNWYAVNDSRGLAPESWIIPSREDWKLLEKEIEGLTLNATKLMSIEWDKGKDKTGFNALPGGGRFLQGEFEGISEYAYFWSSQNDKNKYDEQERAYSLTLMAFSDLSMISSYPKEYGLSVRCFKPVSNK